MYSYKYNTVSPPPFPDISILIILDPSNSLSPLLPPASRYQTPHIKTSNPRKDSIQVFQKTKGGVAACQS